MSKRRLISFSSVAAALAVTATIAGLGSSGSSGVHRAASPAASAAVTSDATSAGSSSSPVATAASARRKGHKARSKSLKARDKGLKIGYIEDNEAVEFAHDVTLSIQAAAKKADVKLIACNPQESPSKALACATTLKTDGVRALINYQDDQAIAGQICKQGPQVPVIAISIVQRPCQTAFTGANNTAAGRLAGKHLGEYFKSKFKCKYDAWLSLEAPVTGQLNTQRMGSYRSGFESICGKIHGLRILNPDGEASTAETMVTDALTALPTAKRVIMVGINDAVIEGGLAAAKSNKRLGDMYASGQGLDPSGVCGMREYSKEWIGDTAYFPQRYGSVVVPAAIKLANGEKVKKNLPAKIGWVTPHTVNKYYRNVKCS